MTPCAGEVLLGSVPIADALAVSSSLPVTVLHAMALATQLRSLVELEEPAIGKMKAVPVLGVVAVKAPDPVSSMVEVGKGRNVVGFTQLAPGGVNLQEVRIVTLKTGKDVLC